MGAKHSSLKIVVSNYNERVKKTYKLSKEFQHNEIDYYIFENKSRYRIGDNPFVKVRVIYGNRMLEKFLVSFMKHDTYSVENGKICYKYSTKNESGSSTIIVSVCKNRIETITYQKSDTLQFNIGDKTI